MLKVKKNNSAVKLRRQIRKEIEESLEEGKMLAAEEVGCHSSDNGYIRKDEGEQEASDGLLLPFGGGRLRGVQGLSTTCAPSCFFDFTKIVTWNVRGLGMREKRRAVHRFVTKNDLDFLFLQESKLSEVNHRLEFCCLGGDYNVVRRANEKLRAVYNFTVMNQFSNFIESLGLIDFPLRGGKFTWCSNREAATFYRLDRFLLLGELVEVCTSLVQKVLPRSLSDHNLLVLSYEDVNWGPKPFRFFNFWMELEDFEELVSRSWEVTKNTCNKVFGLWGRLRKLKPVIKRWSCSEDLANPFNINKLELQINDLESKISEGGQEQESRREIMGLRKSFWSSYRLEESAWFQKSRLKWLLEGDRNTKFYHMVASSRMRIQFANDTLVFCESSLEQLMNVKRILRCFQATFGLKINFNKSSLFGIGVDSAQINSWVDEIRCKAGSFPCTYLGLPLGVNSNSLAVWKPVIEKFESMLAGWKAKCLSLDERITLLKSVFASLPVFYVSLFKIPKGVKVVLDRILSRFLWGGGSSTNRKLHLVDWNSACTGKKLGRLGLVDINVKNRALLNKWLWRFGNENGSLWRKVIEAKYEVGVGNNLLPSPSKPSKTSFIWKGIISPFYQNCQFAANILEGLGFSIGNGVSINFWDDVWIEGGPLKFRFPRIFALAIKKCGKVKKFGFWDNNKWCCYNESLLWKCWNEVWAGIGPPKVEGFCWLVLRGRVAVKEVLARRGLVSWEAITCMLCNKETETVAHLFFSCDIAWSVWNHFCSLWGVSWVSNRVPKDFFFDWLNLLPANWCTKVWKMVFFAVIWSVWLFQNDIIFNGKVLYSSQCPNLAKIKATVRKKRQPTYWTAPTYGWLKFNVDGSAIRKPSQASIGEALRNDEWAMLMVFPIIESDSVNVVKWINNPSSSPWKLRKHYAHIEHLKKALVDWEVLHTLRENNSFANCLAKAGVNRPHNLLIILI
ncbi:hypothetical protein REPUB_Repub13aG0039200 [Reevesia pubescens]